MQTTQIATILMIAILTASSASVVVADEAQYLDSDYSVKDENNTEIPAMTSAGNVRERRANRQYVARKNRRIARWLNPARLLRRWLSMPTARRVTLIAQHEQTRRVTGILGLAALVALASVFPVVGLVGAVMAPEADTEATEAVPAVKRLSKAEWIANKVKQGEDQMLEIIAPLFEGKLPQWAKPWKWGGTVVSMPLNADTGKRYLGANVWNLSGFTIPIFATKRQWYNVAKRIKFDFSKATGTPVLKDEDQCGSRLIWTPFKQKILVDDKDNINKKTGKPKKKAIYVVKKGEGGMTIGGLAEVFNIEDTNLPVDAVAETINFTTSQPDFGDVAGTEDIDNLIMENLKGVQVTHADLDRACYASWKDVITMPFAGLFKANGVTQYESYSATALHEASHATGHRLRAARVLGNVFGSVEYAREELIAEMSSILCMRMLGLNINAPHHGKYLAGWANRVLGQPRDDENKEQWMDACRKVLGEATKASAWVMTGQPDWFEGPKTTEGEAIPQGESEMMHRALPGEEGVASATSATLEWDIHPSNVKGFTTLCKRILRAFTNRGIDFSYEIGDARLATVMEWNRYRQKQVAVERWVVPVTVTHGPLSDSGWTALATIVPFDPSEVGKTEALVRVIPTEAPEWDENWSGIGYTSEEQIQEWQESMIEAKDRRINQTVRERLTNGIYDPTICDHCGVRSHNRKKLVLVTDGVWGSRHRHRIVGSSCLYEYTSIDPKSLENLFTIRENHDPYEGMDTDPYSWMQGIDKRELAVFLDILTELFAIRGGYQKGLGSEAMFKIMGYEIQPEKGRGCAYDRQGFAVEPSMAYYWVEVFPDTDASRRGERSGWEPVSREAGHNLDLGRAATDYIRAALVEAGGAESPRDSFQQTLGVTSRAGVVTHKTCNFVAGSASRFFKEIQKEARDEAHSDDIKAYPAWTMGEIVGADEGKEIEAIVGDKRAFEGNYGPSNVITLILTQYHPNDPDSTIDSKYRIKAFSNAKPVRDAAIGDTVEILSFIPTKVEEWKGQESLMVRSLKIRPIEQEGFNAAMLGPALLMDPTLSTLALCAIVALVALVGAIRVKLHPEPSKLRQIWNDEFGEDHAGQTYLLNCQSNSMKIDERGWCHVDNKDSNSRDNCGAKFPPWAYVIIEPTEQEEREYDVTRDGYMSVYDGELGVYAERSYRAGRTQPRAKGGSLPEGRGSDYQDTTFVEVVEEGRWYKEKTVITDPEDFLVILKEQVARLNAELNGVREVPVDFDWSAELEQEQEESMEDCCEANSWRFTDEYSHRLNRAREWTERYVAAHTQGHTEGEMERFDNYVDRGEDERDEEEESMGAILALPLLMDPSMATLALCGLVAAIGAVRTYLIQEREVIGNTYAVEAESWEEAMEKYNDHDVVGDEAIPGSWECLDDLAPKPLGMVILRPCVNSVPSGMEGAVEWKRGDSAHVLPFWSMGRTKRCYHLNCIDQKDVDRPCVPYNGLWNDILNDDGVCRKCVELEEAGWTLRPQPQPEQQEESHPAILGLPLLMDPTLTTLALGLVGLMVMAGWRGKCSFVGQRYRDQFDGNGIQTCGPGYATVGERDGIPIDEWGWEDGGAFYEQSESDILVFSSERCKIIKTLSANQKKDFVECYKDAEGQNGDVARGFILFTQRQKVRYALAQKEQEELQYQRSQNAAHLIALESRVRDSTEDRLRLLHKDDLIAIILGLEDRDEYVEDCISEHGAVMIGLGLLLDPTLVTLALTALVGVVMAIVPKINGHVVHSGMATGWTEESGAFGTPLCLESLSDIEDTKMLIAPAQEAEDYYADDKRIHPPGCVQLTPTCRQLWYTASGDYGGTEHESIINVKFNPQGWDSAAQWIITIACPSLSAAMHMVIEGNNRNNGYGTPLKDDDYNVLPSTFVVHEITLGSCPDDHEYHDFDLEKKVFGGGITTLQSYTDNKRQTTRPIAELAPWLIWAQGYLDAYLDALTQVEYLDALGNTQIATASPDSPTQPTWLNLTKEDLEESGRDDLLAKMKELEEEESRVARVTLERNKAITALAVFDRLEPEDGWASLKAYQLRYITMRIAGFIRAGRVKIVESRREMWEARQEAETWTWEKYGYNNQSRRRVQRKARVNPNGTSPKVTCPVYAWRDGQLPTKREAERRLKWDISESTWRSRFNSEWTNLSVEEKYVKTEAERERVLEQKQQMGLTHLGQKISEMSDWQCDDSRYHRNNPGLDAHFLIKPTMMPDPDHDGYGHAPMIPVDEANDLPHLETFKWSELRSVYDWDEHGHWDRRMDLKATTKEARLAYLALLKEATEVVIEDNTHALAQEAFFMIHERPSYAEPWMVEKVNEIGILQIWPDGEGSYQTHSVDWPIHRGMNGVMALPLVFLDPSGLSLGAFIGVALAALISMQTQKVKSQTTESGEREMHYALAGYLSDNEDKPTPSDEQMAFINDYCYGLEAWVTGDEASQAIPPLRGPRMVCEAVAGSGKTFVLKIMLDCTRRIEASLVTRASAFNRHIAQTMKDVLKALMKEGFTGADIIGTSNSVQAAGAAIMRDFYEKQGRRVKWQGPTTPIGDQRWRVLSKLAVTEAMTPEVIQSVVASGLLEKPNQRPYYNRIVTDVTKTVKALADAGYLPRFDHPDEYCEVASAHRFANRIDKMKKIVKRVEGPMGLNDICIHWIPDDLGWTIVDEAFKRIVETAWLTTEITVEDDCLVPRLGGYTTDLAPLSVCAHEAKTSIIDFKVKSGLFWPPREEEEKARNRMPAGSAALTLTRIEGLKDGLEGYNGKLLVQFGDGRAANTKMEDAEGEAIPAQQWVKDYAPGHRNGARFGNYWPDASGLIDALGLKGDWIRIIDEHDPTVETLARRFSTLRGGEGFNGPDQASGPTPQSDTMILSFADQVFLPNYFDLYLEEKWDVAFIDELQDLSVSRSQLIWRCIDLDRSAIVCVADRKQSIYFWSGSSTTAFDDTIKHIDATTYPMTYSWRGGNHVAEAAVRICAEGLEDCKAVQPDADYPDYSVHSAPPIEGWRDGGRTVTIDHSRIADAVKHIRESEYPLSDTEKPIAVLSYLTGALSGVIIQLVKAGIPITTPAGDQGIVTTVCNLLNKPFYDRLTNKKQKQGVGFNGLGDYSEYAIMSRLERVERMEFDQAVKRANGDVALADKDDYYTEVRDILEMAECLIELWASALRRNLPPSNRRTVAQFKKWCNEVLFAAKGDSVHLSTVHRFKGDEAGVVFMLRGVPVKNRRTGEMEVRDPFLLDHLLKQSPDTAVEQMNVLYVAATRALDQTIVVRSDDILREIPAGAILNDSWGVVAGYSTTTIRDDPPDAQEATPRCGDCDDRVNPDDHGVCSDCGALLCNHRVPERGRRGGKLSNAGSRTPTAYRPQIITDKTDSGRGITSCGTYDSRAMTFDEMFSDEPKPRICVKCYKKKPKTAHKKKIEGYQNLLSGEDDEGGEA